MKLAALLGPWRLWAPITYFAIVSAAHLEFSLWLVAWRPSAFGSYSFSQAVPALAAASLVALACWAVSGMRRSREGLREAFAWAAWFATVWLADRFLTYSINEMAHYPEYALLAILIARAIDPARTAQPSGRILFWTSLLGAIDELVQYVWLTPGYGNYYDFNDCLANLVGAALGVLIYYRAAPPGDVRDRGHGFARRETLAAVALLVAVAIGVGAGRLQLTPATEVPPGGLLRDGDGQLNFYLQRTAGQYDAHHPGQRHGEYYALGPASGLALMFVAGSLFQALACRRKRHAVTGWPRPAGAKNSVGSMDPRG